MQHKTLAMADCDYSKVVITKRTCGAVTHFTYYPLNSVKTEIQLRRQTAQNQLHSLPLLRELHSHRIGSTPDDAGEIRDRLIVSFHQDARLRQTLMVFVVDENTRIFIDKMSCTIAIDYDLLLKTLRENVTEKKAMTVLAKL